MNYKRVIILLLILLLIPFTLKLRGQDFGQHNSLFTDIKAHRVGDILTVLIYEDSRGSSQVSSKNEKTTTGYTEGGPGLGALRFIPMFRIEAENETTFDGKGQTQRNGSLRARMSVTVVAVKPSGDLVIEGSRSIGVSGEKETLGLTGVVRSRDIGADNTIESYLIADAEIHYSGKGPGSTSVRPGFLTRLVSWIF